MTKKFCTVKCLSEPKTKFSCAVKTSQKVHEVFFRPQAFCIVWPRFCSYWNLSVSHNTEKACSYQSTKSV